MEVSERDKFKEEVEKLMRKSLRVFKEDERLRISLVNSLLEVRKLLDDYRTSSRK